jgi:hypothetical protein
MSINEKQEKNSQKIIRLVTNVKLPVFIIVFIIVNVFALRNFFLLSRDMVYGDFSAQLLFPSPRYAPERLPSSPITMEYQAANRLGADFTPIYFPAQQISKLDNAYNYLSLDPLKRPSRTAPLVLVLCSKTLCKLGFGHAALGNILLQLFLFFPILYFVFSSLGIKRYFLSAFLFTEFILLLTPVGLSWFERSQFSLYVAISYLLLLFGLTRNNAILIILSAGFAFIKWTSLPCIFVILAAYIMASRNKKELRHNLLMASLFGFIMILLLLPLIHENISFIYVLIDQEASRSPHGLSLVFYLPRAMVKALPFALILIGLIIAKINRSDFIGLFPFFVAAAVILLLYPTEALDYSVPTLLGLIPLMIFWAKRLASNQRTAENLVLMSFLLFVCLASFSIKLIGSTLNVVIIYLFFSIALMISPIFLPKYFEKSVDQAIASEK